MFFACLECFKVVDEWPAFEDAAVVPVVCSACTSGLVWQEAAPSGKEQFYAAAFTGLRVLVVDDDLSVRSLLKSRLRLWGCTTEEASDGNEGVEKYRPFRPDLVLMDFEMPILNGLDASRCISKDDPEATIILVTGIPDSLPVRRALHQGLVKEVIGKPFNLDHLALAIHEALKAKPVQASSSGE